MIRANHRLLLVLTLFVCCPVDGAIYRCIEASGVVLYSQFRCTNAQLMAERPVSVIVSPELTTSERLMLSHIAKNSTALDRASRKQAERQHRQREKHKTDKASLCRQALIGMANLRAHKRAGYSLSEATALDGREDELHQQQSQNC